MTLTTVINAAGKLTALGASVQSSKVRQAQADAARYHVDLNEMRSWASSQITEMTGAQATCITSGAAAGIAISVAAVITGTNLAAVNQLPDVGSRANKIILQAGHEVNFGAPVTQMIRMAGGEPLIIGSTDRVSAGRLHEALQTQSPVAMLFVQSHHCAQDNMLKLAECIDLCKGAKIAVIVDAAAEEDLRCYIAAGADLVTYSGGKAFGGPTSGFITGRSALIEACELQSRGIARTMKVGKEQIAGLVQALAEYAERDELAERERLDEINGKLIACLDDIDGLHVYRSKDEAGRSFERVSLEGPGNLRQLVKYLAEGDPSIRTRNHLLSKGIIMIDPRELRLDQTEIISERIREFYAQQHD